MSIPIIFRGQPHYLRPGEVDFFGAVVELVRFRGENLTFDDLTARSEAAACVVAAAAGRPLPEGLQRRSRVIEAAHHDIISAFISGALHGEMIFITPPNESGPAIGERTPARSADFAAPVIQDTVPEDLRDSGSDFVRSFRRHHRLVLPVLMRADLLLWAAGGAPEPPEAPAPPVSTDMQRTGLPGRPAKAKHLLMDEHRRRLESDLSRPDLKEEAQAVLDWLAETYPECSRPALGTTINNLTPAHRAHFGAVKRGVRSGTK